MRSSWNYVCIKESVSPRFFGPHNCGGDGCSNGHSTVQRTGDHENSTGINGGHTINVDDYSFLGDGLYVLVER
jgi:hypothetical protein